MCHFCSVWSWKQISRTSSNDLKIIRIVLFLADYCSFSHPDPISVVLPYRLFIFIGTLWCFPVHRCVPLWQKCNETFPTFYYVFYSFLKALAVNGNVHSCCCCCNTKRWRICFKRKQKMVKKIDLFHRVPLGGDLTAVAYYHLCF